MYLPSEDKNIADQNPFIWVSTCQTNLNKNWRTFWSSHWSKVLNTSVRFIYIPNLWPQTLRATWEMNTHAYIYSHREYELLSSWPTYQLHFVTQCKHTAEFTHTELLNQGSTVFRCVYVCFPVVFLQRQTPSLISNFPVSALCLSSLWLTRQSAENKSQKINK